MKTYVKPEVSFVDLCVEERLAGSVCENNGSCDEKTTAAMINAGIYWSNL